MVRLIVPNLLEEYVSRNGFSVAGDRSGSGTGNERLSDISGALFGTRLIDCIDGTGPAGGCIPEEMLFVIVQRRVGFVTTAARIATEIRRMLFFREEPDIPGSKNTYFAWCGGVEAVLGARAAAQAMGPVANIPSYFRHGFHFFVRIM